MFKLKPSHRGATRSRHELDRIAPWRNRAPAAAEEQPTNPVPGRKPCIRRRDILSRAWPVRFAAPPYLSVSPKNRSRVPKVFLAQRGAGRAFCVREKDTERGHFKKTAVKIPHVEKARASKTACEISDRDQVETEQIGASYFLESRDFARGVEDVRAGRPPRFDAYAWNQGGTPATDRVWAYEKGRQFATIGPRSMPLRINSSMLGTPARQGSLPHFPAGRELSRVFFEFDLLVELPWLNRCAISVICGLIPCNNRAGNFSRGAGNFPCAISGRDAVTKQKLDVRFSEHDGSFFGLARSALRIHACREQAPGRQ